MKIPFDKILFSPDAFFRDAMGEEENFTIPALIVLAIGILSAAYGYLLGKLTSQIMAAAMPGIESILLVATILGAIISAFIFWLCWAGVIYGISALFHGEGSFKRTLEFVGFGFLPQIIGSCITVVAAYVYLPKVSVPYIRTAGVPADQLGVVIQHAVTTMMHDPAMVELTRITALIAVVFLLWSAHIWISGLCTARKLSPRNAAICAGIPVLAYIFYLLYHLGVA
jgi:hypothetical protein